MGEAKKKRDAGVVPGGLKAWEPVKNWNPQRAFQAIQAHRRPKPATTPDKPIRQKVINFCGTVSIEQPVFLPWTKVSPDYRSGWCHNNVLEQVRRAGGKRVNGWMIWDNGNFVESEFHSVWEDPQGNLIDLTPRADGEPEILFLPDHATKITNDGTADHFPNNRTTISESPFVSGGIPMPEPSTRREYSVKDSPFGFPSVAG